MRTPLALTALALLAACGHKDDNVGGVSPEEDRMLNDAASSLDVTSDNAATANATTATTAPPSPQGNAQ